MEMVAGIEEWRGGAGSGVGDGGARTRQLSSDAAETSKSRTRKQLAFPCEVEQCDRAFASHQKMVTHCLKKHSMVIGHSC